MYKAAVRCTKEAREHQLRECALGQFGTVWEVWEGMLKPRGGQHVQMPWGMSSEAEQAQGGEASGDKTMETIIARPYGFYKI